MVWHSFLLNPRWFRRSCGDGKKLLYKIDFPWASIVSRSYVLDELQYYRGGKVVEN
jgi:hypothetical protein